MKTSTKIHIVDFLLYTYNYFPDLESLKRHAEEGAKMGFTGNVSILVHMIFL